AAVFDFDVAREGVGAAENIDDDGVVDDQFDGRQRVDAGRIAAERLHGLAHGGQVDHRGYAGEILEQHARGSEGDFPVDHGRRVPAGERLDVLRSDVGSVLGAQQALEQDLQTVWKAGDVEPRICEGAEPMDFV